MKKFISLLLCAVMLISCVIMPAHAENTTKLKFGDDGKFRILHFADFQDIFYMMNATKDFIHASIEKAQPDLIVLGGDNITGGAGIIKPLTRMSIDQFMSIFEEYSIPVAAVFGNHDSEGAATKEDMMKMYESYDCFIGCAGEDLTGCGNYNLPIYASDSDKVAFNLWLIDSLTYNESDKKDNYCENDLEGYACVHKDQIDWYVKTSNELKAANGGKPVPSLVFQHIVVPEIYDALVKTETGYTLPESATGVLGEDPCPPNYSNGQFDAMVNQGDVLAMFFGHDHTNTYEVEHKGIDLVNTPGAGFHSYGDNSRGARVIDLDENDLWNYETELIFWREIFDVENNALANYRFIYSASEYSTAEQIRAFFLYIYEAVLISLQIPKKY
ncbi:MAG: metallophosphoesterase family protein [Clostridia bacterium]|nr:metallophosphoesterase family protein [Clostridia bacterium]